MSPERIAAFFREFKHPDPGIRRAGLLRFAALARSPFDFARLAPERNARAKHARGRRAGNRPPPELFAACVKLLAQDSHTRVRRAAAAALGVWGARGRSTAGATEAVLENLARIRGRRRQPESVYAYLRALADLGAHSEEAAETAARFLFEPDEPVRLAAGATLANIGCFSDSIETALRESVALDYRAANRTIDLDSGARQSMIALGRLSRSRRSRETLEFLCEHLIDLHRAHRGALAGSSQSMSIFAWILSEHRVEPELIDSYFERFDRVFLPHRDLLRRPVHRLHASNPAADSEGRPASRARSANPPARIQLLGAMSDAARELLLPLWEAQYSEDWLPFELLELVTEFVNASDRGAFAAGDFFACKPNQWCTPETFAACWAVETVGGFARALVEAPADGAERPVQFQSESDPGAESLRRFLEYLDRALLSTGPGAVTVDPAGGELDVPAFGGVSLSLWSRGEVLRRLTARLRRSS